MATKQTEKQTEAKAPKAPKAPKARKAPKADAKAAGPRHPHARVVAAHQGKEALAKALAPALAHTDQDTDQLASRLAKASNQQLLRLERVVATVKKKYGSRDKLIEAIGSGQKKAKDKDFLAKLATLSLPNLLELAASHDRRTRA
jgi:hypothetical protein